MSNVANEIRRHAFHSNFQAMFHLQKLVKPSLPLDTLLKASSVSKINRHNFSILNYIMMVFFVNMRCFNGTPDPILKGHVDKHDFFLGNDLILELFP